MSKASDLCEKHRELILSGTMMSVDPSSGGPGSNPGWALWEQGRFVKSGMISIVGSRATPSRLGTLLEQVSTFNTPDIMIVEDVGIIRGKFPTMNKSLIWSVGVVLAALKPKVVVEIMPKSWQKYTDKDTYIKSDENDAVMLGWAAICMALKIDDKCPQEILRTYGK